MRVSLGLGMFVLGCLVRPAFGQDPTVPSKEILQRMTRATVEPKAVVSEAPVVKLKAMVLSDANRGTGIIEANGRRYTVKLERADQSVQVGSGIEIAGRRYLVEDFSARSILLNCDGIQLLVQ